MISCFLFYYVTSKFLAIYFQGVYTVMAPIFLLTFIGQTLIFYGGSYLLLDPSHRIPAFVFRLLWIIYFLVMFLLLFFRVYQDNNINLNLLKPFNFETINLSQVTLNLILFIPIGYWLNWFKISSALLISSLLITSIEILQLLIHRRTTQHRYGYNNIIGSVCEIAVFQGLLRSLQSIKRLKLLKQK